MSLLNPCSPLALSISSRSMRGLTPDLINAFIICSAQPEKILFTSVSTVEPIPPMAILSNFLPKASATEYASVAYQHLVKPTNKAREIWLFLTLR